MRPLSTVGSATLVAPFGVPLSKIVVLLLIRIDSLPLNNESCIGTKVSAGYIGTVPFALHSTLPFT
jgi:hypothetical protein